MILKSITLRNFRQFLDAEIPLDINDKNNVILIKGDNTTGKTCLTNAFTWCLFGKTNFKDPVLNRKREHDLKRNESAEVMVTLCINRSDSDFYITRTQEFKKLESDQLAEDHSKIKIRVKEHSTGETRSRTFLNDSERQDAIDQIIPEYLSSYLFLKGEMINSIEEKIHTSGRVPDLSKAVKVMLGLQPLENALGHLKAPGDKQSVLRIFEDEAGDAPGIAKIYERRVKLQTDQDNNKSAIETNKQEIEALDKQISALEQEKIDAVPDKKEELNKLQNTITNEKNKQSEKRFNFLASFPSMLEKYLSIQIYSKTVDKINESEVADDYREGIEAKAVQKMLDDELCMCGNSLKQGTDAREKLIKLLDSIPPKSIGGEIDSFKSYGEGRIADRDTGKLEEEIKAYIKYIVESQKTINTAKDEIDRINQQSNNQKTISDIENDIREKKKTREDKLTEQNMLHEEKGKIEKDLNSANDEYEKIMHKNDKYKFINLCRSYTEHIYNKLDRFLKSNEETLLTNLNDELTNIFFSVFGQKDYKLKIDKYYKLEICDQYNKPLTLSGAENIFVVLSYISAILNLAMTKKNSRGLQHETYPWVLDAPFSNFGDKNTTSACIKLPEMTKQIIILSKPPEVDKIKDLLRNRINKYYEMSSIEKDGKDTYVTNVKEGRI